MPEPDAMPSGGGVLSAPEGEDAQAMPGADAAAVVEGGADEQGGADDDLFRFSDADADDDENGRCEGEAAGGGDGEDGEVRFELSHESDIPQEFAGDLGKIAKQLGVPGDKGAKLIEQAWSYAKAQHAAGNKRLGAELRREWGSEFDAKVGATKSFAARMARRAGLSMEQMAPMMSPHGFRLLNAMREMVQEGGGYAGAAKRDAQLSVEQQIDQIYESPELFRALSNPGDPRHNEVNARLNKLMGIV